MGALVLNMNDTVQKHSTYFKYLRLRDSHPINFSSAGIRRAVYAWPTLTGASMGTMSLAFAASYQDVVCGAYPLGNGYRWYLPTLMRFNAPDAMSPFGAGGFHPYIYCGGDPTNATDPSGHVGISASIAAVESLTRLATKGTVKIFDALADDNKMSMHLKAHGLRPGDPVYEHVRHAVWLSPKPRIAFDAARLPWEIGGLRAQIYTFEDSFGDLGDEFNLAAHGIVIDGEPYVAFTDGDTPIFIGPEALAVRVGDLSRFAVVRLIVCHSGENGAASFAQRFARAINKPVIGFDGPVNSSIRLPEVLTRLFDEWADIAKQDNLPAGWADRALRMRYEGKVLGNNPAYYHPVLFFP